MSFYRAPFRDFVQDQLRHRVNFLAQGMGNGKRPDSWYQQYLTKQAFVRVSPLVKIIKDDEKNINGLPNTPGFDGSTDFMKNFVLEGVPLKNEDDNSSKLFTSFKKMSQFPSNLSSRGNKNSLLNNPIIKTSPDGDGFGIVPPPGVISCGVDTKSFYGNLREAKLSIRCFSIAQFEWVEKLYARPGHHILLEWGWDHYIDNPTGNIKNGDTLISDREDFWDDNIDAGKIYQEIEIKKKERSGNYDGFLGIIKNFTSKVENDGGFTINIQLIGRGDLLASIPLNERSGDIAPTRYNSVQILRDDDAYIKPNGNLYHYTNEDDEEKLQENTLEWGKDSHSNLVNLSHHLLRQPYRDVFNNITKTESRWHIVGDALTSLKNFSYDNPQLKWKTGLEKANWVGFFNTKVNVDTFILKDFNYRTKLDASDSKSKKIYSEEVGLGPFVRLGYLLKCVNYLGINEDGVGKPMVTINNLLYTKDFNPNESIASPSFENEKVGNIYPSCYSNFSFEGNMDTNSNQYNDFIVQILEQYDKALFNSKTEESEHLKKVTEALKKYSTSFKKEDKLKFDKLTKNPGSRAGQWRKEIGDYYKQAMTNNSSEDAPKVFKDTTLSKKLDNSKLFPLENPDTNKANYIYDLAHYVLKNAGSCQPSKILFPHQFEDSNVFKDWTEKPTKPNPYFYLYNLPILSSSPKPGKGTYGTWKGIFNKERGKLNPQAIISDNYFGSLSSHAMIDSLAILRSQEKISKEYQEALYLLHKKKTQSTTHKTMSSNTNGKYIPNRVIDNILINTKWLSEYLEDNEENLNLGQFLKEICKQINTASGNSTDLKVIDNPVFADQVSIVDFNINSTQISKDEQFAFPKGGRTSIFKSLSLTGKIPDAQASTIAIGAQGPRNASNIESVTYAAFLEDIEDRISHPGSNSSVNQSKLIKIQEKKQNKYTKTFIRFFQNAIDLHLLYICLNLDAGSKRKEWFTNLESKAKRAAARMTKDSIYLAQHYNDGEARGGGKLPISSIIPLKVSIGMEGVSGILASNTFKLEKGILPPKYNDKSVSYMISKEKQVIKGGVWETTIEGSLVLDDNKPNTVNAHTNQSYPKGAAQSSTNTSPPSTSTTTPDWLNNIVTNISANVTQYASSFIEEDIEDPFLEHFQIPIEPNSKGMYMIASPKCEREGKKGIQSANHQGYDLISQ